MVTESPEAAHTARTDEPELTGPASLEIVAGGVAGSVVISIGRGQLTCLVG